MRFIIFAVIILMGCCGAYAAEHQPVNVRLIYSGMLLDNMAVIYPEKLEQNEIECDINFLKECMLSLDIAATTGSIVRDGVHCTTVSYNINKVPIRPVAGNVVDVIVTMLKRYEYIHVEFYCLSRFPRNTSYSYKNKYVNITAHNSFETIEMDIRILDSKFTRIRTRDIYRDEKKIILGIVLLSAGLVGIFCIYAVTRKME